MRRTPPIVEVIIVTYNSRKFIEPCLAALAEQTLENFRAHIIDNASDDDPGALFERLDDRFNIVINEDNVGFATACNQAADRCTARWIAMLNPDTVPDRDWLEKIVAYAEAHDAAAVGCKQVSLRNPAKLDGAGDVYSPLGVAWRGGYEWRADTPLNSGKVFSVCGAAALYRRDIFLEIGGFDDSFFCYMEDVDFCFRLHLQGHTVLQCNEINVGHFGSGISETVSDFRLYYGSRNRIWTWIKNTPLGLFILGTPFHIAVNIAFLARSIVHGRFGVTLRAYRDALAQLPAVWRARKRVQEGRKAGSLHVMRAMTWSPIKLITRAPDVRELE